MNDKPEASIGGEVVEASPALSLDAGFTKASLGKMTLASLGLANWQLLRADGVLERLSHLLCCTRVEAYQQTKNAQAS